MNRITKNIVSITIIFILIASIFFTMNYIKENRKSINNMNTQTTINHQRKEKSSSIKENKSNETIEQKEDNSTEEHNSSKTKQQKPTNDNETNIEGEPPTKPEGEMDNENNPPTMPPDERGNNIFD